MIIEYPISITDTDLSLATPYHVLANTAIGWDNVSGEALRYTTLSSSLIPTQIAGFFFKEFSIDGSGNTVPTSVLCAFYQGLKVSAKPRLIANGSSSITLRMTPFLMYNVFNPSTATFANLESWIKNDTETNAKFNILDFKFTTGGSSLIDTLLGTNGTDSGSVSTFNRSGGTDLDLVNVTAVGVMCEIVDTLNVKNNVDNIVFNVDFTGATGSNRLYYIPQ